MLAAPLPCALPAIMWSRPVALGLATMWQPPPPAGGPLAAAAGTADTADTVTAVTAAAASPALVRVLGHLFDIWASLVHGGTDRRLQDWVEDRRARRCAHRCGGRARGAGRIEQPPLEDDPHRLLVADHGDAGDAEPGQLLGCLRAQAELAVGVVEQHHHRGHV